MRTPNRIQIIVVGLAIAACIALLPCDAPASDVGIHMGYYFDSDAISLGFGWLTSLSDSRSEWFFNPNAEVIVGDRRDMTAFNFDFHYDFAVQDNLTFWAGAGPGLYVIDRPFDDDLQLGLNMLAGFGSQTGSVRPFVQGKAVFMDNSEASLSVGIRF
jgi:hypothetical protein